MSMRIPKGVKYLDGPGDAYLRAMKAYSEYYMRVEKDNDLNDQLKEDADKQAENDRIEKENRERKEAEDKRKAEELRAVFETAKAEFTSMVVTFKSMSLATKDSVDGAADSDKRSALSKLENEFQTVKSKLVHLSGIDPSEDIEAQKDSFAADVEIPFLAVQKDLLSQLKTSGGASQPVTSNNTNTNNTTRKESVKLPDFEGDENKNPYLEFPTWKKRWDTLISEYDSKFHMGLLLEHVDESAKTHIVGLETDYDSSIAKLNKVYGDPRKVISCVVTEVMSQPSINEGDYSSLIRYSNTLTNNYTRLKNLNLTHEMSNNSAMAMILRKFPRLVGEKWSAHLVTQDSSIKVQPFDTFISWLMSEKEIWEQMISNEGPLDGGEMNPFAFFIHKEQNRSVTCHSCGKEGHMKWNCPDKQKKDSQKSKLPRPAPKVVKFWCALHLGDPNRRCYSSNCQELRHMDAAERIKLLKKNGDCSHCLRDHKTADCPNPDRVCGGGKPNRGCTKNHKLHEMFCAEAKVFMVHSMTAKDDSEGVVLLIMTVRTLKRGVFATVFWDLGCTSNFIREAFAKKCGFAGEEKTLSVTTLGGVITDYRRVIQYTCFLRDENGNVVKFEAYGMDSVTGDVSKIEISKLKRLFPHLADSLLRQMCRGSSVDVLIGMYHSSWHPERSDKAKGGGDFWVYRGMFGACVGGRHPEMYEGTRRSDELFYVNHTYHNIVTPIEHVPHELEYCRQRVQKITSSGAPSQSSQLSANDGSVPQLDVSNSPVTTKHPSSVNTSCGAPLQSCQLSANDGCVPLKDVPNTLTVEDAIPENEPTTVFHLNPAAPPFNIEIMKQQNADPRRIAGETSNVAPSQSCQVSANDGSVPTSDVTDSQFTTSQLSSINTSSGAPSQSCQLSANDGSVPHLDVTKSQMTIDVSNESNVKQNCVVCNVALTSPFTNENLFYEADALGTLIEPRCGGCRCDKCPVPGSKYSVKEQREFDRINNNLFRKGDEKRWYTPLPWKEGRHVLPKNEESAYRNLLSLEKMLKRNEEKATALRQQIQEMIESDVAVLVTDDEFRSWKGNYHFLPMVLVRGKKRWRVCFDAARSQCGYPAFNKHLFKGPDRFLNSLLSVIIGFRNGRVGAVADITKFHNQVRLVPEDAMMQLFYWRDLNPNISPSIYSVPVNNFGTISANCIATCALHKSADRFADVYPEESTDVKDQSYIDDMLVADDPQVIHTKTSNIDEILADAGMKNKGWTYSGDVSETMNIGGGGVGDDLDEMVLGLSWLPKHDHFRFNVALRFKIAKEEVVVTSLEEFLAIVDDLVLTRRMLSSNVARIFDPVGLICPIILQAKLLMRELWTVKDLGWDDPIPLEMAEKWIAFLLTLLNLRNLKFPRSFYPTEEVEGLPILVIFTDGSMHAYGSVAYIRWQLKGGSFWSRIIMAKCKLGPKVVITIPRMELCGAVLGERIKNFILKDTKLEFEGIYQLVDSSTVLGYVNKEYGEFKAFEGHRVAEIQSSNEFHNNMLKNWAWVAGSDNPADWCTKPRRVEELYENGFWESGPSFLKKPVSQWPIKHTYKKDNLEGMLNVPKPVICSHVQLAPTDYIERLVSRVGSWRKMVRVMAWMIRGVLSANNVPFDGDVLTSGELSQAKRILLKFAQKSSASDLELATKEGKGRYRKLAPVKDEKGVYRVGSRLRNHVPFTFDGKLPVILPNDHQITKLVMAECHIFGHYGQDGTLSRFRSQGFWTTRGGNLAKKVKRDCVPCRKANPETLQQQMGELPMERLQQPIAWGHCQMDLFGPFTCRSDVNTRSTKKIWGLLIEDSNSGAVYIDIVLDYSTAAVLLTLRRFGSIRGWPGVICTDPGSQLESASGILERWWQAMEKPLREFGTRKNFQWKVSPADSPWRQGKAERRIGIVKKLMHFAVGDTKLTPVELQTTMFEVSNICNERPIGLSKPREDGTYVLITPNQLMMGRSSNILPDDTDIVDSLPMIARYRLVKHVTEVFWHRWSNNVSPGLIVRQKWHKLSRNLCIGDVVLICEPTKLKSKYKMGIIETVVSSNDGVVRSATVRYVLVQRSTQKGVDHKVTTIRVQRSVQRLVLILPVEEQEGPVEVEDHESHVECVTSAKAGV